MYDTRQSKHSFRVGGVIYMIVLRQRTVITDYKIYGTVPTKNRGIYIYIIHVKWL